MSRSRKKLVLTGAVGLALLVAGVGAASASGVLDGSGSTPMSYAPSTGDITQAPDPTSAERMVLQGLDQSLFESVSFDDPPSPKYRPGLWMYVTMRGTTVSDGNYLPTLWQAELAQGAIADHLSAGVTNLADVIEGSTILLDTGDGAAPREIGGGAGDVAAGQIFGAQSSQASDATISTHVKSALEGVGLSPQEVRVLHPLGAAVYIRASIDDPSKIQGQFDSILNSVQAGGEYEGIYLEIEASDGTPLVRSANAYRIGAGSVWFAPGNDELLNINHGGKPQS